MKGWLDKYKDGGPVQENYNDYSVSAPKGYVGDGTFNEGRDYSPAWGGQFQNGGELANVTVKGKRQPIIVTNPNDPRLKAYKDSLSLYNEGEKNYKKRLEFNKKNNIPKSSTRKWNDPVEYHIANKKGDIQLNKIQPIEGNGYWYNYDPDNVAGTNVPSSLTDNYGFRYKKPTQPVEYINRIRQTETPELQDLTMGLPVNVSLPELQRQAGPNRITMGKPLFKGGPQTDYYTPIDESGNVVQSNDFRTSQYAMGGSIPGAVGFTYARTQSPAPSNGKYAKKTKASAQDGTVMPLTSNTEKEVQPVSPERFLDEEKILKNTPQEIISTGRSPYRFDMLKNAVMHDLAKEQSIPLDQVNKKEAKQITKELLDQREKVLKNIPIERVKGNGLITNSVYGGVGGYFTWDKNKQAPVIAVSDSLNSVPFDEFKATTRHEARHAYDYAGQLLTNYENDLINSKIDKSLRDNVRTAKQWDQMSTPTEIMGRIQEIHGALRDSPEVKILDSDFGESKPTNSFGPRTRRYNPAQDKVKLEYLKSIQNNSGYQDLIRLMKPKDIVELMNTIAANNFQQGIPIAQDGKEIPGEFEPIQVDPEEEFLFMGKKYEEPDRSREFPFLVPKVAEELSPIDININQKNLGVSQHTFTHQPGMHYDENLGGTLSDSYMLKRTANSFPTDEDVRLNVQMPDSPKDINFISNYKGAIGAVDQYPTSVPFEGEKHWNIDRFIIDPHFGSGNPNLENDATDKVQQRRNVLADMYKYYLLQNKGDKDASWKQANEFMTKEIDPRISGPMYEKLRGNISYSPGTGITSVVGEDYVRNFNELKNSANLPDSERSEMEREFLKNPTSDKQAKDLAMDWLTNYKKMSPKEAESYYNKLPKKQNGGEMKFYQNGLDFTPKSISKNGKKIIKDDMGQWAHPGEITEIGSNQITMQGVPYPVLGVSDLGDIQMMYPDEEYEFIGDSVTEYPMMKQGGQLTKLDQLSNFTNYNTKQPGSWLDKYQ